MAEDEKRKVVIELNERKQQVDKLKAKFEVCIDISIQRTIDRYYTTAFIFIHSICLSTDRHSIYFFLNAKKETYHYIIAKIIATILLLVV